jgi:DNA-binding MarR family transcriptional regulator
MGFVIEQLKLLGLNGREVRVFTTLSTFGRMNMTLLGSRAGLPRTTTDSIIRRLLKQGLVVSERVEGHKEYRVDLADVSDKLASLNKKIHSNDIPGEYTNDENNVTSLADSDRDHARRTLLQYFSHYQGERAQILLGIGAGDEGSLKRFLLYVEHATAFHIKVEIIVCRRVLDRLTKSVHGLHALTRGIVRLNIVPAGYCTNVNDMVLFRDRAVLVNPSLVSVDQITSPQTVEALRQLTAIACESGWSIDLSALLQAP